MSICTKLYVYGRDGLTIEDIPTDEFHKKGNKYIECYDYYKENPEYGFNEENKQIYACEYVMKNDDITDINLLYLKGIIHLLKNCRPKFNKINN